MRNRNSLVKGCLVIVITIFSLQLYAFAGEGEEYSIIEKDHKKGLVNRKGRVLIPTEYEDLGWTNGGTRLLENVIGFKKNNLWGVLNTKNERITEPLYTSLTRFNESSIVASKKKTYNSSIVFGVIDSKGNAEIAFEYTNLQVHGNQLIASAFKEDKYLYGIIDEREKPVIPMKYDRIVGLTEKLYEVTSDDHVAIFSIEGTNLTEFSLDSVRLSQADYILTYRNGKVGMVSDNGNFIIQPDYKKVIVENGIIKAQKFREWLVFNNVNELLATYAYDDVVPKDEKIYKVKVGEAEALIHENDSLITDFAKFEILEHFGEWISIEKEGKKGVLHLDGQIFLEPLYDSVRFISNVFLVKHKRNGVRGWSIIDINGDFISNQVYDEIDLLGDTYFKAKRDKYWGVVNSRGDEIIFCKYDSIVEYTQGKLLVKFLGEDGILNLDGNWEILPQNKDIEIVDPMRYLIRSPYGSYVAYYPDTKDFTAEFFLYKHGDRYLEKTLDLKFGLLDEEGNRVIKPQFDEISELQEDSIYYAKSDKGYSFITKSGQIMISEDNRFQEINPMSEEFIGVKIDDRWGFVDINGKLRVANQYENVGPYNEGLAPIKILGRWGYIDKREDIVVQPAYDSVNHFKKGVCEVVKKGKFGIINAQGKITLDCEYDNLFRLKTGGFLTLKENKYGLADDQGKLLILPRFEKMMDLDNGYVIASRKNRYGLLSNDGVNIIPMIYEELKYDTYNDVYLAAKSPEWVELKKP